MAGHEIMSVNNAPLLGGGEELFVGLVGKVSTSTGLLFWEDNQFPGRRVPKV